jgi:hypothetical protein
MIAKKLGTNRHNFSVPRETPYGPSCHHRVGADNRSASFGTGWIEMCSTTPGMVGWWSAEGNANDITGNGHYGTRFP